MKVTWSRFPLEMGETGRVVTNDLQMLWYVVVDYINFEYADS